MSQTQAKALGLFIIFIGIIARLIWPQDMPWMGDQIHNFQLGMEIKSTGHWPLVGIMSGSGISNPGLSAWIFGILAFFSNTPLEMVRLIQILNVVTLLSIFAFVTKFVKSEERENWYFGLLLYAISPLAVLFSKGIWSVDMYSLFSFCLIFSFWFRDNKWGAFLWGLFGALSGQVHLSGFFFAFGFVFFALVSDFLSKKYHHWQWWVGGSILGTLPMLPWIKFAFLNQLSKGESASWVLLKNIYRFRFQKYFLKDGFGFNLDFQFGRLMNEFLEGPIILGQKTHLNFISHYFLYGICFVSIGLFLYNHRQGFAGKLKKILLNWKSLDFLLLSSFLCAGIVMVATGMNIYSHYLIVWYPLQFLLVMRLARARWMRYGILVGNIILLLGTLSFIHERDHAGGHYGKTYRSEYRQQNGAQ